MNKKYLSIPVYVAMAAVLFLKLGVVRKLFELSLWPDMTFYMNLGLQPGIVLPVFGSILTGCDEGIASDSRSGIDPGCVSFPFHSRF